MKRLLALIAAFFIFIPVVRAQSGFGIKGGLNFNTMSDIKPTDGGVINVKARTGYHFGVMYKLQVPLVGLAIQPELLYINKSSKIDADVDGLPRPFYYGQETKLHYFQLPVGFQWGLDLVMLRPYLQVTPFVGYAIAKGGFYDNVAWDNINRFEYGIGLGAGLEVWKIQISGRYSWDLGKVGDFKWSELAKDIKGGKNKGFELSVGFLF